MMAADAKRLNEAKRTWLDERGEPINIDRAWQKSDAQIGLTRRTQALLAAAGQSESHRRWYVLRVAQGSEIDVDNAFKKAGIERWLPAEEVVPARRAGMGKRPREAVLKPFWPGYMFVKVANTAHAWAGLATVDGVLGVLGTAESPAPVDDEEVNKLKLFLEQDEEARMVLTNALRVGDRVVVEDGPFRSFEALVTWLDQDCRSDRVKVDVFIFGRETPVDLELAQITRID